MTPYATIARSLSSTEESALANVPVLAHPFPLEKVGLPRILLHCQFLRKMPERLVSHGEPEVKENS